MGKHSRRANKSIMAIIVILVIIAITTFLFKKNQKSINGESIIEGIKIDQTKITRLHHAHNPYLLHICFPLYSLSQQYILLHLPDDFPM